MTSTTSTDEVSAQEAQDTSLEAGLLQEEQDRTKFIGGSDVAAVMGLSPWMTPVELWEHKTRRVMREVTPEMGRRYKRGHKLEPFIREMVIEKLTEEWGLQVELVGVNQRYTDPEYPFLAAEIDFELLLTGRVMIGEEEVAFDRAHVTADAKSVTGFARKKWGDIGTDEVPIEYAAQFMHGLGIRHANYLKGRESDVHPQYCLVAALRSFDDVDIFWVKRDNETIEAMRQKCIEFWQHVQDDTPPDPVRFSDLTKLFPRPVVDLKDADDETIEKVSALKRVKAAIKDLEDEAKDLQFEVGKAIGDAAGLKVPGGTKPIVTWNAQNRSDFNVKRFREDHPDLCAAYTESKSLRVMLMK